MNSGHRLLKNGIPANVHFLYDLCFTCGKFTCLFTNTGVLYRGNPLALNSF